MISGFAKGTTGASGLAQAVHDLDQARDLRFNPLHRAQSGFVCRKDIIQVAETKQKGFRQWLDVATWYAKSQEEFQERIICTRRDIAGEKLLSEPCAMAFVCCLIVH